MLLDPAPGTLVRACKCRLNAAKLKAILLSHKHLDHSSDVNVMIEAMAEGGFHRRGVLLAPSDALDDDPVVLHYVRPFLERIEVLKEGGEYRVDNVSIRTPLRHVHPVETYGMILRTDQYTISCIVDTRYFDELCRHYQADLLIINLMRLEPTCPAGPSLRAGCRPDHQEPEAKGGAVEPLRHEHVAGQALDRGPAVDRRNRRPRDWPPATA